MSKTKTISEDRFGQKQVRVVAWIPIELWEKFDRLVTQNKSTERAEIIAVITKATKKVD